MIILKKQLRSEPVGIITRKERALMTKAKNQAAYNVLRSFVDILQEDNEQAKDWKVMINKMRSKLNRSQNDDLVKEIEWQRSDRWKSETVSFIEATLQTWSNEPNESLRL